MYITEIQLKDFRNYENLNVQFNKNVNIFLGPNAQGKTNLLESIFITSMGKSFRTSRDKDMIRFGAEFFRVKIQAFKEDELVVEMAVNQDGKKGIKIDGVKANKLSQLFENLYMVIFSPEDLRIVKDEPEKRRKFIDRELCQIKPSYYMYLNQYKKTLMQRNAYLKEPAVDEMILDIWDSKLSEYGSRIISIRDEFVKKINSISREIHRDITNHKENLEIFYEPSIKPGPDVRSVFYEELKKTEKGISEREPPERDRTKMT